MVLKQPHLLESKNNMSPLLSIIIPAFNVEQFIEQAICSAQNQTLKDIEIIVVDDNSTDGTRTVIEALTITDSRIRIIANTQLNAGQCGARNAGLWAATGFYTGFLDGDDYWHPKKAASHIAFMEQHPEVDLTFSRWSVIDETGRETGRVTDAPRKRTLNLEDLLVENVVGGASNVICRTVARVTAGDFDLTLKAAVDLDLWLRIARLRNGNISFINEVLTFYRLREGQITKDWKRMADNWDIIFDRLRAEMPDRILPIENEAKAKHLRYRSYLAYEAGEFPAARQQLVAAFKRGGLSLLADRRTWITAAAVLATILPEHFHKAIADAARTVRTWVSHRNSVIGTGKAE